MSKRIGYARVSTRHQQNDRQEADLVAASVRRDDLYLDHGVSGDRASRPALDRALQALEAGDTLVVTTLDRLGRSTAHMLNLVHDLQQRDVQLRVLNLGGEVIDTGTPTGRLLFTIMAALAQLELEIKRERVADSVAKRRAEGGDLGGRPQTITASKIDSAIRLLDQGIPASKVARDIGISRATLYRRIEALRMSSG